MPAPSLHTPISAGQADEPRRRVTDAFRATSPGPQDVRMDLEALRTAVRAMRGVVRGWTSDIGLDEELAESIVLATDEAVTNAVEHAFPDGPGRVWLLLRVLTGGDVVVVVADDGAWRTPPAEAGHRGRGLGLMRGLADEVEVDAGPDGTTVGMRWDVPVQGGPADAPERGTPAPAVPDPASRASSPVSMA